MERAEQGRAIGQIGLGWSEQSKYNQSRSELVDQIEVRILYQIGSNRIKSDQIRVSRY